MSPKGEKYGHRHLNQQATVHTNLAKSQRKANLDQTTRKDEMWVEFLTAIHQ